MSAKPSLSARETVEILRLGLPNGLRAILNGFDNFPELQDEMDKLRVRKRELEEIGST